MLEIGFSRVRNVSNLSPRSISGGASLFCRGPGARNLGRVMSFFLFAPDCVGNRSFSPQNVSNLSPRSISGGASRFWRGPVARNLGRHVFDPSEAKMIGIVIGDWIEKYLELFFRSDRRFWIVFDPVGSKKCGRQFLVSGCLEKREMPPGRSCREIRHILRREIPISNIFRGKKKLMRTC